MTLLDARPHRLYRVVSVEGEGATSRRMLSLGLTPGVKIELIKIAPFMSVYLVSVRGFLLAVKASAAARVTLKVAEGEQ